MHTEAGWLDSSAWTAFEVTDPRAYEDAARRSASVESEDPCVLVLEARKRLRAGDPIKEAATLLSRALELGHSLGMDPSQEPCTTVQQAIDILTESKARASDRRGDAASLLTEALVAAEKLGLYRPEIVERGAGSFTERMGIREQGRERLSVEERKRLDQLQDWQKLARGGFVTMSYGPSFIAEEAAMLYNDGYEWAPLSDDEQAELDALEAKIEPAERVERMAARKHDQKDYTHYVVVAVSGGNLIESGWSYDSDAKDALRALREERREGSFGPARVLTRRYLKGHGLDPADNASWYVETRDERMATNDSGSVSGAIKALHAAADQARAGTFAPVVRAARDLGTQWARDQQFYGILSSLTALADDASYEEASAEQVLGAIQQGLDYLATNFGAVGAFAADDWYSVPYTGPHRGKSFEWKTPHGTYRYTYYGPSASHTVVYHKKGARSGDWQEKDGSWWRDLPGSAGRGLDSAAAAKLAAAKHSASIEASR